MPAPAPCRWRKKLSSDVVLKIEVQKLGAERRIGRAESTLARLSLSAVHVAAVVFLGLLRNAAAVTPSGKEAAKTIEGMVFGQRLAHQARYPCRVRLELNRISEEVCPQDALTPVTRPGVTEVKRLEPGADRLTQLHDRPGRRVYRYGVEYPVQIGRRAHLDAAFEKRCREIVDVRRAGVRVSGQQGRAKNLGRQPARGGLTHERFCDALALRISERQPVHSVACLCPR